MHVLPPAQCTPQLPQFRLSLVASTHAPLQSVSPAAHMDAQPAWLQTSPGWQALPQPPQWNGSLSVSTQFPEQATVPAGQTHVPAWQ
jgi:hypothetical protein